MKPLLEAATELLQDTGDASLQSRFIERLTFSTVPDILEMLKRTTERDFLALPVWARNLAYRLACLQAPLDAALHREAAADLRCFGPDWDDVALELERRAEWIERQSATR